MNPIEIWNLAFSALKDRKLRTILTILMVVIGVTLVTSLNGLGGGFNNFITYQLSQFSPNILIVSTTSPIRGMGEVEPPPSMSITMQTAKTIENFKYVKFVQPTYRGVAILSSGGKIQSIQITGIQQSNLREVMPTLKVEEGTLVGDRDRVGILLGHSVAYPPGQSEPFATVGRTIKVEASHVISQGSAQKTEIETRSFIVRGILATEGNPIYDKSAFVNMDAANSLFNKGNKFDSLFAIIESQDYNNIVETAIKEKYGDNLAVTSPQAIAQTVRTVVNSFSMFILSIAIISMIVAAVGIITTLFTSVRERTKEIGLLKALGFRNRQVIILFLTESLIIGLIGGTLGVIAGIGGGFAMVRFMNFGPNSVSITPNYLPSDLASVWTLALTLSLLAGLYPSWKASRLDPVVALRTE